MSSQSFPATSCQKTWRGWPPLIQHQPPEPWPESDPPNPNQPHPGPFPVPVPTKGAVGGGGGGDEGGQGVVEKGEGEDGARPEEEGGPLHGEVDVQGDGEGPEEGGDARAVPGSRGSQEDEAAAKP